MLIPRRAYGDLLLTGQSSLSKLHGFGGRRLDQLVLSYTHKEFGRVFSDVANHVESITPLVENEMASIKIEEEKSRLLTLGCFIVCNAVVFSLAGGDMDATDIEASPNQLPALPLQGGVKSLMRALQAEFDPEVQKIPMNLGDLVVAVDGSFVTCRLKNASSATASGVEVVYGGNEVPSALFTIPFGIQHHIFYCESKSMTFINQFPLQREQEEEEHGLESEKINASRIILKFLTRKKHFELSILRAVVHFRWFKHSMRSFIKVLRNATPNEADKKREAILCHLNNLLQGNQFTHQRKSELLYMYNNCIVDEVECNFCDLVQDVATQNSRDLQWATEGRVVPFPHFVKHYNFNRFRVEWLQGPASDQHMRDPIHQDNCMMHSKRLDELVTVLARLSLGTDLLNKIVTSCQENSDLAEDNASWYLNTAEMGREMVDRHSSAWAELHNAAVDWSRCPIGNTLTVMQSFMQFCIGLPQEAETFFLHKVNEEANLFHHQKESLLASSHGNDVDEDNPIKELVRGPYLNIHAASFVPGSML